MYQFRTVFNKQSQALEKTGLRFLGDVFGIIFFDAGRNSDAGGDDKQLIFCGA